MFRELVILEPSPMAGLVPARARVARAPIHGQKIISVADAVEPSCGRCLEHAANLEQRKIMVGA
jgi:hypothetical protein